LRQQKYNSAIVEYHSIEAIRASEYHSALLNTTWRRQNSLKKEGFPSFFNYLPI